MTPARAKELLCRHEDIKLGVFSERIRNIAGETFDEKEFILSMWKSCGKCRSYDNILKDYIKERGGKHV